MRSTRATDRVPGWARGLVAGVALLAVATAQADTVASLLGNFTTNQFVGARIAEGRLDVRYTVVLGQLPALRELHVADTNRDGVTSQAERDAYARELAAGFAGNLAVAVDGERVRLRPERWTTSLPTEQGGFSLRLDVDYTAALPAGSATHAVTIANDNYPGRFGWQEIAVEPADGIAVFATNGYRTSLTAGLTESVPEMPASGPLAERAVQLSYRVGAVPAGAIAIAARTQVPAPASTAASSPQETTLDAGWLARQTRGVVDLIATPDVAPGVQLWALLAAMVLGALHAFSPGHGKSVVGAYLIGSRATARHAAFLGLTVTVTHTLGVFALGFATLLASAYVVPEKIFPLLGLASGLIVAGMGVILAIQRWPAARAAWRERAQRGSGQGASAMAFRSLATATPLGRMQGSYVLASLQGGHGHAHDDGHSHHPAAGHHAHGAGWHSHGGTWHSHLPPGADGERVTWRSLAALGVSGGLVPCPSAMVLLLAAIALNKTAFGMALVVAFSAGLALTLMAIGLVFLYARSRIPAGARAPRWTRLLPFASAGLIAVVGVALCYSALTGGPV